MRSEKSYPALPWLGGLSAVLFVVGTARFFIGASKGEVPPLAWTLAIAVALPFVALLFARRVPVGLQERHHLDVEGMAAKDLDKAMKALDASFKRGELPAERYEKAKERLEAARHGRS